MTVSIAHLSSRALVSVTGPDWRSFLQGLITQDVETLQPDEMRYAALLTPQGRLWVDFFVTGANDGVILDAPAKARAELIGKLTIYRLRAQVQIAPLDAQVLAAWGDGAPANGAWRRDPRLPELGWRGSAPGAEAALSEDAYDLHRLSLGVADPAKDAVENDYPIEANFDLLGGIDFKKGCFVGQETTSRMHRRGIVKTRLAPIAFDGAPPPFGADIMTGERRAGEVRGGVEGRAMALMRIDRSTGPLTVDGRRISLDPPPWLAPLFQAQVEETPQS